MSYNQNELFNLIITWNNFSIINKKNENISFKIELGWNAFVVQFYVYVKIWLQRKYRLKLYAYNF